MIIPIEANPRESIALSAIYFLEPTEESVDQLVRDYTRKALYPSVHLFFTSGSSAVWCDFDLQLISLTTNSRCLIIACF